MDKLFSADYLIDSIDSQKMNLACSCLLQCFSLSIALIQVWGVHIVPLKVLVEVYSLVVVLEVLEVIWELIPSQLPIFSSYCTIALFLDHVFLKSQLLVALEINLSRKMLT